MQAQDLLPRERWVAFVFALLVIGFGLWPGPLLDIIRPAAEAWVGRIG